jgi:hypothetical protein
MALHQPLCDVLAGLWALLQEAAGNRSTDFRAYAEAAFGRAAARTVVPQFERNLAAVRAGE